MKLLDTIAASRIDAFEREWRYDTTYLRSILAVGGIGALRAIAGLQRMSSYRKSVPVAPWFAAKIVAARAEDCGPCVQLVVSMAERAHVDSATLRALLANDLAALPDDVRLVARFTEATLAHAADAAALRDEIVARWGEAGVVSLAYAIASSRVYPTLKYALGYGHACVRVEVAGEDAPVRALAHA